MDPKFFVWWSLYWKLNKISNYIPFQLVPFDKWHFMKNYSTILELNSFFLVGQTNSVGTRSERERERVTFISWRLHWKLYSMVFRVWNVIKYIDTIFGISEIPLIFSPFFPYFSSFFSVSSRIQKNERSELLSQLTELILCTTRVNIRCKKKRKNIYIYFICRFENKRIDHAGIFPL